MQSRYGHGEERRSEAHGAGYGDRNALTSTSSGTQTFRLAFAAIVLAWLGARVAYWNGYYTEDAPGYVTDAIWMALGEYHARDHVNGLNVGTYLPVALPVVLFGKSEIALSLWPLFCSLLGLVSLAGTTSLLFGRAFGLLAALLYATYPGDVFFSTVVMPDSIQAGWLSFSVFLIVLAFHGPANHRYRWLIAGGIAMGVCHLIRANDAILCADWRSRHRDPVPDWRRDTFATLRAVA